MVTLAANIVGSLPDGANVIVLKSLEIVFPVMLKLPMSNCPVTSRSVVFVVPFTSRSYCGEFVFTPIPTTFNGCAASTTDK